MQTEADLKEDTPFSTNLYRFLSMQMQLWPSLQASLSHLSSLPHPYNSLSAAQLCTQLTNDYHKFIMTHDVDQQSLEDYLWDVLEMLMIEEEVGGMGGVRGMARQAWKIIGELQQGKWEVVDQWKKDVFDKVKEKGVGIVVQDDPSDNEQDYEDQDNSDEDNECEEDELMQDQHKQKQKQQSNEEQIKKEQELEEDGWTIVRKKK